MEKNDIYLSAFINTNTAKYGKKKIFEKQKIKNESKKDALKTTNEKHEATTGFQQRTSTI